MSNDHFPDNLSIFIIRSLFRTIKNVKNIINQAQLTKQIDALIPQQLLKSISQALPLQNIQITQNEIQSYAQKLIKINQQFYDYLIELIQQKWQFQQLTTPKNTNFENKTNNSPNYDYQSLQQAVQKAQQQVRKHIGIEHQMKICLQQVEQQLQQLIIDNQSLKKQLAFLKKQLSISKKKQLQTVEKLNKTEQKLNYYENKLLINNSNNKLSKLHTQPQQITLFLNNQTSRKSFKKSFQSNNQKVHTKINNKRSLITKLHAQSNKLASRKHSKLIALDNSNDIDSQGLNSLITQSKQKKKNHLFQTEQKNNLIYNNSNQTNKNKEMFWNKRLRKKQSTTLNGLYTDISTLQYSINHSLNISPRQLRKKKLKQKQIKEAYAINLRDLTKKHSVTLGNNEQTVMKRKNKQQQTKNLTNYNFNNKNFNQINFQNQLKKNIKIGSLVGNNFIVHNKGYNGDRSKSMAY